MGVVESIKAASDIYSPLTGAVIDINESAVHHPEQINTDPYGSGWLFKLTATNPDEWDTLLTPEAYAELVPGA